MLFAGTTRLSHYGAPKMWFNMLSTTTKYAVVKYGEFYTGIVDEVKITFPYKADLNPGSNIIEEARGDMYEGGCFLYKNSIIGASDNNIIITDSWDGWSGFKQV